MIANPSIPSLVLASTDAKDIQPPGESETARMPCECATWRRLSPS